MYKIRETVKSPAYSTLLFAVFSVLFLGSSLPMADTVLEQASKKRNIGAVNLLSKVTIEPVRRMRGKHFAWDHEIQVALPPSYHETEKTYPVLWVTDGLYTFDRATRLVYSEIKQYVPEMIVVAVGVPLDEVDDNARRRPYEFSSSPEQLGFDGFGSDFIQRYLTTSRERNIAEGKPVWKQTGGASQFLDFIVDEVRPALLKDYRMSQDHTLFGHSGGGYFCTFALLARTGAFSKYICGSPNLYGGNYDLFHLEERYAKQHQDMKAAVFFGAGEEEMLEDNSIPAWAIVSSMARMVEMLSVRHYPSLDVHMRLFPGEDHISVVPMNLEWGLRTLWKNKQ